MIKVLLHQIFYPLSMGRYYERALEANPNVDLRTVGVYTGAYIPWMGGMTVEQKYAKAPTYVLPFKPDIGKVPYEMAQVAMKQDGDWSPDLVLTIDAGVNWIHRPKAPHVASVGTDAHCLDYTHARSVSDKFFNMHPHFASPDDIKLHYAYSKQVHYPMPEIEKDIDAVLIGMPYPQRVQWIDKLRSLGVSVLFENAPIFDEYRELNNRARIGLNFSSSGDLNARVFELCAMKLCPVIDRCPDLPSVGFVEGEHYLGFDTLDEAVEKVLWAKAHPVEATRISENAYQLVTTKDYTYDSLLDTIFKEFNLQ